ncbi:hypothetical protein L1987_04013 [Smallanthus sonchifolius]|uniref:Uncharacterized protein n=1 Tax=Smallanthus sonchifolius TaxID=185202 RepID=A0ACB9KC93_9ASTR|nr:hypothetical protein L1987_04013 [Smallanthus sonchifolius]
MLPVWTPKLFALEFIKQYFPIAVPNCSIQLYFNLFAAVKSKWESSSLGFCFTIYFTCFLMFLMISESAEWNHLD